jgi:putative SbcD/Mre11-related phosphoesterase
MVKIGKFEAIGRCLYWKEEKILVVGDLHLGYENFLTEHGWSFPKTQLEDTLSILEDSFENRVVEEVVLLGDIKHYFSGVLSEEFSDFRAVINLVKSKGVKRVVVTKGNHDAIIEPLIERWGFGDFVEIIDVCNVKDVLFFHGHKESWNIEKYDKKYKTFVIGHFHPAVKIREGAKAEIFKCFLHGKSKGKEIIVVPSFFTLVEGTDVSSGKLEGWFDVSGFKKFVVADRVYDFGKMS